MNKYVLLKDEIAKGSLADNLKSLVNQESQLKKIRSAFQSKFGINYSTSFVSPSSFGIDNIFYELTPQEEFELNRLLVLKKHWEDIAELYSGQTDEISDMSLEIAFKKIKDINKDICDIQGHRLSEEIRHNYDFPYSWREKECLECGEAVNLNQFSPKDVVVRSVNKEL